MNGRSCGVAFALVVLGACQQDASALVTQTPSVAPRPATLPTLIWERTDLEPFAVVGNALLAYDRTRDGIVDLSSATGEELRFRKIASGPVSGTPGMWVPVNGGYLVSWDERIVFIREQAGALSFGWMVGQNSWYTAIGGGDVAWLGKSRDESGLYAIDVKDGHTRWAAKFPPDIQGFEMGGDATTIVTSHQEYQHMPPGEHDIHHVFAGYDSVTGNRRWRVELADEPSASAVGVGGAIAVTDGEIKLYDGKTGVLHTVKLASPSYVHVWIDRGLALIDEEHSHTLSAYAIFDGHPVWNVGLPPMPTVGVTALSATFAAHGDMLFVAAHGQVHAFARATGKLLWSVQTGAGFNRLDATDAGVVAIGLALDDRLRIAADRAGARDRDDPWRRARCPMLDAIDCVGSRRQREGPSRRHRRIPRDDPGDRSDRRPGAIQQARDGRVRHEWHDDPAHRRGRLRDAGLRRRRLRVRLRMMRAARAGSLPSAVVVEEVATPSRSPS